MYHTPMDVSLGLLIWNNMRRAIMPPSPPHRLRKFERPIGRWLREPKIEYISIEDQIISIISYLCHVFKRNFWITRIKQNRFPIYLRYEEKCFDCLFSLKEGYMTVKIKNSFILSDLFQTKSRLRALSQEFLHQLPMTVSGWRI